MTLLEVAKQALEAMEDAMYRADTHEFYDAKESLRYAIEQAEQQEPFKPDWVNYRQGVEDGRAEALEILAKQEPVAWGYELATTVGEHGYEGWSRRVTHAKPNVPKGSIRNLTPLYPAPTPRKPLTDEELRGCFTRTNTAEPLAEGWPGLKRFARAIERAHGIGEHHGS